MLRPWEPDAASFRWQMRVLAGQFHVLSLAEAVQRLRDGSLPPRTACVTFDDGYADNESIALPVLRELKIPATFFVATGFLDGGRMWNDTVIESVRRFSERKLDLSSRGLGDFDVSSEKQKSEAIARLLPAIKHLPFQRRNEEVRYIEKLGGKRLPDDLMMTSEQVKNLHDSGMGIGAHTTSHPILANIDFSEAKKEMEASKTCLEGLIEAPVTLFAYPNGKPEQDYQLKHTALARELGFEAAFTTSRGTATSATDFWQIPRFTPWDNQPARFYLRLLYNYLEPDGVRQ